MFAVTAKIKTRAGVFETNSSSSHSLVIGNGALVEQPFGSDVSWVVPIYPGEYGWVNDEYSGPHALLSYLFTDAMSIYGWDDVPGDPNAITDNEHLNMLREAVRYHAGVELEFKRANDKYHPFGYIDHQSDDLPSEVWSGGVDRVIQFVFGAGSYVETGNDNGDYY